MLINCRKLLSQCKLKYFKEINTTTIKVKNDKKVDKATVLAMLSDIFFGE